MLVKQPLWQRIQRDRLKRRDDEERDASEESSLEEMIDLRPTPGDVRDVIRDTSSFDARTLRDLASAGTTDSREKRPGTLSDQAQESRSGSASPEGDRQAAYAAWADRVKSHKQRKLSSISGDSGATEPPAEQWQSDALFEGSKTRLEKEALSDLTTTELLAMLGLLPHSPKSALQKAYREAAKIHHPDRWIGVDDDIRSHHEMMMRRVSEAYNTLKATGW